MWNNPVGLAGLGMFLCICCTCVGDSALDIHGINKWTKKLWHPDAKSPCSEDFASCTLCTDIQTHKDNVIPNEKTSKLSTVMFFGPFLSRGFPGPCEHRNSHFLSLLASESVIISVRPCLSVKHFHLRWLIAFESIAAAWCPSVWSRHKGFEWEHWLTGKPQWRTN